MDVQEGLQLGDLAAVVRRRAGVVGAVAGLVFLAAVLLAAFLPNQYEAYTTLLVEPQSISRRLIEAGLESSDLGNRLHLMTMQILSRPRLSRVIDDLKLYAEESEQMTREEVIELMRSRIRIEPVVPALAGDARSNRDAEINTFRLLFRGDSAKSVAAVANRLANDFIEEHIKERVQVSGDTSDFIESERARLAGQIREIEGRITQVKAENAGQLPEDFSANQRLLERAIDRLRAAEQELAQAESDAAFYQQQALNAGGAGGREDAASPLRRLRLLELGLAEYRSRGFTDKHPDVVAARQEIDALRQRLEAEGLEEEAPLSAAQQNARAEQQRAALRASAAVEEIERLRAQIEAVQARLAATPRIAEQLDGLQREYKHLFASYQEYSSKQLEASVAANMERRQKGEQFRVLEVAYPPPRPSSPNRPLIAVLGVLLGLALGGGLGLVLESVDSSFHDARQLQQALRIPVLAAVPAILFASDRRRIRRRRVRNAVMATGFACAVLGVAAVGYVWVNGGPSWLPGGQPEEAPAPSTAARVDRES